MTGWRYYNHALIPTCAPHDTPDLSALDKKDLWRHNKPLFAMWISCWDCKEETDWWYIIKDTPFDITSLKSKRRYEITKGKKNFSIEIIDPQKYKSELFAIAKEAFALYPEKYRPKLKQEEYEKDIDINWSNYNVFLARNETDEACGYACCLDGEGYTDFKILKTVPSEERKGINAALVNAVLEHYNPLLSTGRFYICDGSRSVFHETNFQAYLEKYFGFRKAYCKLHIRYRKGVKALIITLSPLQKAFSQSQIKLFNQASAVMKLSDYADSER